MIYLIGLLFFPPKSFSESSLVEARRVELLSESLSIGFSPGAVDLFSFPIPDAGQQASDISSS